jgi:hypothetical protein
MRLLLLLLMLPACRALPDVCAEFVDQPCIALEVRGEMPVDQIKVSGLAGFRTTPGNDGASPGAAAEFRLPVILAVLPPGEFRGDYSLAVRGILGAQTIARGGVSGSIGSALHVQASVTLEAFTPPPPPEILRLTPPITCVSKTTALSIDGMGLRVINGVAPTVEVDSQPLPAIGCGISDGSCDTITTTVGVLDEGTHSVQVVNPPPESVASESATLHTLPRPDVVQLSTNAGICQGFDIEGVGFYRVGAKNPTVKIDGAVTTQLAPSRCSVMMVNGVVVENCQQISVLTNLPAGDHRIVVVGAPPLDCESESVFLPCF